MIESTSLSELAKIENGLLLGGDASFDSVSIDTRTINEGDLFVAIRGDAFDGHDYIDQAERSGCCGIVTEKTLNSIKPNLQLKDTTQALGIIAGLNRLAFKGIVFGLTGSSGKTTTKNMLAAILNLQAPTCSTAGNFNNEIGVPLTLLKLESQHQYAVVEMGARKVGDIGYLGQFVKPDIAILLNAGIAHIDVFGSYENIVSTKGEIYSALGDKGIAVLNADDPAAEQWSEQLKNHVVFSFSLKKPQVSASVNEMKALENRVWAENIECKANASFYTLHFQGQTQEVSLPIPGLHNVANSLASATAALAAGISLEVVAQGLGSLEKMTGRLEQIELRDDLSLIDDSYNANPDSMVAALNVLSLCDGYKAAVLGEMAELGAMSKKLHSEVAEYAAKTCIDKFYLIGSHAEAMALNIGKRAKSFETKKMLVDQLCTELVSGETILVKGSRSAAMDDVVEFIKGEVQ